MDVGELGRLAKINAEMFPDGDTSFGYELWRRAMMGNEWAWVWVFDVWKGQVARWVRRQPSWGGGDAMGLVGDVFVRFWRSVGADRFTERFPTLHTILGYLKQIVFTAVIDATRTQRYKPIFLEDEVGWEMDDLRPVEAVLMGRERRAALWGVVVGEVRDDREWLLLEGKKARVVFAENAGVFDEVKQVYRMRENLLKRVRRRNTFDL